MFIYCVFIYTNSAKSESPHEEKPSNKEGNEQQAYATLTSRTLG